MVTDNSHCDRNRLILLLDDLLPETVESEVARHVEHCLHCQSQLESLAAGTEWWVQAREFIANDRTDKEQTSSVAASSWPAEPQVADRDASPARAVPAFLTACGKPGVLGQLGSYEVSDVVGRGGMGVVLKAHDGELDRYVAIKVLAPEWAASAAARRRFTREAQAAAAVVHPNVMPIHAVGNIGGLPYLVMPYVPGTSLQARIDLEGPLEVKDVLRIGMQTAAGLAAAHTQGLVHRDIKPANVLLENGLQRVLITDFGLARAVDDASLTRTGSVAGTPHYMSPEQAKGERVDHRTDLFSLGSTLYALCTGRPPFRAESTLAVLRRICEVSHRPIREINSDVPEELAAIIDNLLAKSPADRPLRAAQVAEQLGGCLARLQQPAGVEGPEGRTMTATAAQPWWLWRSSADGRRPARWRRAVIALSLLSILLAGFVAGILVERSSKPAASGPAPPVIQAAGTQMGPPVWPIRRQRGEPLPAEFRFDFAGGNFDPQQLFPVGVDTIYGLQRFQREASGLRVTVPPHQGGTKPCVGFVPLLTIHGDFEITASYELLAAAPPAIPACVGADLYVLLHRTLKAAGLRRGVGMDGQQVYFVHWSQTDEAGERQLDSLVFPAEGRGGKLRLQRSGAILRFLVADGEGFRVLHEREHDSGPIGLLRVAAMSDGATSTVDVRWHDLTIRAGDLIPASVPLLQGSVGGHSAAPGIK